MSITQLLTPALKSPQPGRLTLQRRARMRSLLSELSLRDMDYDAVAAFLGCSCSAARSYMKDLSENALVRLTQRGGPYRITADLQAIAAFMSAEGPGELTMLQPLKGRATLQGGRRFHILSVDGKVKVAAASAPAQRDPLVSALFGS